MLGALAKPVGDGGRGRGEPGRLGGALGLVDLGQPVDVVRHRQAARPDHRTVRGTCDDGHARQDDGLL